MRLAYSRLLMQVSHRSRYKKNHGGGRRQNPPGPPRSHFRNSTPRCAVLSRLQSVVTPTVSRIAKARDGALDPFQFIGACRTAEKMGIHCEGRIAQQLIR